MEIKGNKSIKGYKYILAFDLASVTTGLSLFDLNQKKPIYHSIIKIKGAELNSALLQIELTAKIQEVIDSFKINKSELLILKEAPPQQMGKFTTIKTIMSLAKSHCVLDNTCYFMGVDVYNWEGIYPITCKAYYKRETGIDKPQKQDISKYLENKYGFYGWTLDETDSLSLVDTLLGYKYNKDIEEDIKALKKHCKELKIQSGIDKIKDKIEEMEQWKI